MDLFSAIAIREPRGTSLFLWKDNRHSTNTMQGKQNVVIIGNGIAGITAARHIRKKSDHNITVIGMETDYFFSRTALMYIYMGQLRFEDTKPYPDSFWKKNRIGLIHGKASRIDLGNGKVHLQSGMSVPFDTLILATGSSTAFYDWPGQELKSVQGLFSFQDLLRLEESTPSIQKAVLVGGGLIGTELAEMLKYRNKEVTFLVREPEFYSHLLPLPIARLIGREIRSHGIDLRLNTQLKEILPDENGIVRAVVTDHAETLSCGLVGIATGVKPNIELATSSGLTTNQGILVNAYLQTSAPNIFAIGDCAERDYDIPGRNRVEPLWYTGKAMGECVAATICGDHTLYDPGPPFNSAKFFDLEYQTYGVAGNVPKEGQESFYWEHSGGKKCLYMVWEKDGTFSGTHSIGLRLRHSCFDRWLREGKSIGFVMGHLEKADFSPEFHYRHLSDIREKFYHEYPGLSLAQQNLSQH